VVAAEEAVPKSRLEEELCGLLIKQLEELWCALWVDECQAWAGRHAQMGSQKHTGKRDGEHILKPRSA
jgi:hypothetical protein